MARFVAAEAIPLLRECFERQRFPRELIPGLANLGVLGAGIQGYDCAGLNAISYGLICQELERGDSALRSFVSVQSSLCMHAIHAYGSDAQRLLHLPRMARGEVIGCFGLTEAHGGSDPANLRTHARRKGDDWILNGSKIWITNGSIADIAVIWATTDSGLRGFLVDTHLPGFEATVIENKMSLRASDTAALYLTDVCVPADALLPDAEGLRAPLSCLNQARYGISWGVIGAAQDCLRTVLEYTDRASCSVAPWPHAECAESAWPTWRGASPPRSCCPCTSRVSRTRSAGPRADLAGQMEQHAHGPRHRARLP